MKDVDFVEDLKEKRRLALLGGSSRPMRLREERAEQFKGARVSEETESRDIKKERLWWEPGRD